MLNVSWKTIAVIALTLLGLLAISREIHSWFVLREATSIVSQVQHHIAQQDKAIQARGQYMAEIADKFDKAIDSDIDETDRRIEETGKQMNEAVQRLNKASKEQLPMRSFEDSQRDFEKFTQQMIEKPFSQQKANKAQSKNEK